MNEKGRRGVKPAQLLGMHESLPVVYLARPRANIELQRR